MLKTYRSGPSTPGKSFGAASCALLALILSLLAHGAAYAAPAEETPAGINAIPRPRTLVPQPRPAARETPAGRAAPEGRIDPSAAARENYKPAQRAVLVDAFGANYRDSLSASRLARDLIELGVENVFLQTVVYGEAFYNSTLMPSGGGLAVGYRDPLADILARFKTAGADAPRLHAWISPLQVHNTRSILTPPADHVVAQHPDWLTLDVEGNRADSSGLSYLDPGNPDAQEYVVGIVKELAGTYDLAGIYLDGFSYPEEGSRFGYNAAALKRYAEETGSTQKPEPDDAKWREWRAAQLTNLLERIATAIKAAKPSMLLTVTTAAEGVPPKNLDGFRYSEPWTERLQNWPKWAQFGVVDWICMKNYFDEQLEPGPFNDWLAFAVAAKGEAKVTIAIAGYRNWALDAFSQVRRIRLTDADGIVVNNYRQPVRDIAATKDFFAAVKAVTIQAEGGREPAGREGAVADDLRARLERMRASSASPAMTNVMERVPIAPGRETPAAGDSGAPLEPSVPPAVDNAASPSAIIGATSSDSARRSLLFGKQFATVHLTNGNVFEGHKLGEVNGEALFETNTGLRITIPSQMIERIESTGGANE